MCARNLWGAQNVELPPLLAENLIFFLPRVSSSFIIKDIYLFFAAAAGGAHNASGIPTYV
jgi:hypothetical protein